MAQSYNGWPADPNGAAIGIDTKYGSKVGAPAFGSGGYAGGMKSGSISTVFTYLITQLEARVEEMADGDGGNGYGCWGYSYRANVNNPSSLSCHASGTAIDYNAPKHPNGTSTGPNGGGGWTGTQYYEVCEILDEMSGALDWLTSNDPMHFEADVDPATMDQIASTLPAGGGGGGGSTPSPTPPTNAGDKMYVFFKDKDGKIYSGDALTYWHVPDPSYLENEIWRLQDVAKVSPVYVYDGNMGLKPVPTTGSFKDRANVIMGAKPVDKGNWGRQIKV